MPLNWNFEPINPVKKLDWGMSQNTNIGLEDQLQSEKTQKEIDSRVQFLRQQQAQEQASNPANWTHQQSVDYFKQNPPRTPEEEAQVSYFVKQKKQNKDEMVKLLDEVNKSISEFGKQSFAETLKQDMDKEVVMKTIQEFCKRL